MIQRGFGKRSEAVGTGFFLPQARQVHSARVEHVMSHLGDRLLEADAFVTTEPRVVCRVATADCVPLLFWDAQGRIIGAVHAGWRGVAAEIVRETLNHMRDWVPDAEIHVAMGPAMARSCYEVGEEVVAACAKTVSDISHYIDDTRPGHYRIDLKGVLTEQLMREGVLSNCIENDPTCTHCDVRYASFRRGDRQERQYSWIVISD